MQYSMVGTLMTEESFYAVAIVTGVDQATVSNNPGGHFVTYQSFLADLDRSVGHPSQRSSRCPAISEK